MPAIPPDSGTLPKPGVMEFKQKRRTERLRTFLFPTTQEQRDESRARHQAEVPD